jgi:hypothetical protein
VVRDCDLALAKETNNLKLFQKLYFGTPFARYRLKILRAAKVTAEEMGTSFKWQIGSGRYPVTVNICSGTNSRSDLILKGDQVPHRLLKTLCRDFYHPQRLLEVFERLFPGEFFVSPFSFDKSHQALRRLRKFFAKARVPLIIEAKRGFYSLQSTSYSRVFIEKENPATKEEADTPNLSKIVTTERILRGFSKKCPQGTFTAKEFRETMKMSERTAYRNLKFGVEQGLLKKKGKAPRTCYHLNPSLVVPK